MKTSHTLTVDLPIGPDDLGAEIEVDIYFRHEPGDPPLIEFFMATPRHPFSGAFADLEQERLDNACEDWLGDVGYEIALRQVAIDKEEGL